MATPATPQERPYAPPPTAPRGNSLVDRAWSAQYRIEARARSVGRGKYGRVLRMTRKPTRAEFNEVAKITAIGLALLGAIGFIIWYLMREVPRLI